MGKTLAERARHMGKQRWEALTLLVREGGWGATTPETIHLWRYPDTLKLMRELELKGMALCVGDTPGAERFVASEKGYDEYFELLPEKTRQEEAARRAEAKYGPRGG